MLWRKLELKKKNFSTWLPTVKGKGATHFPPIIENEYLSNHHLQ
jgi:hypothetical protein